MGKWDDLAPWESQVRAALLSGDLQGAMEALVLGYQHAVVGYCTSMLGDAIEGEDRAQEVFLAAWRALPNFRGDTSLVRTWLFAIARNQCVKHLQKTTRRQRVFRTRHEAIAQGAHVDPPVPLEVRYGEADQEALAQRHLALLPHCLKRLPRQARVLLMMHYYEDLSYADTAKQLRMAPTTVRRETQKAEKRLKQCMGLVDHDV